MKPAFSVAVAALLVTSLLAVAIVAADSAPEPIVDDERSSIDASESIGQANGETTTRLGLDGPTDHEYTEPAPDLGATLAIEDDQMRNDWTVYEAEHNWQTLSPSERQELLETLEDRLADRIDELEARERDAAAAVGEGDVSVATLLRTLVRNDREAKVLADQFQTLSDLGQDVPDYSIVIRSTLSTLELHEGPVREHVFETITATDRTAGSSAALVEVGESGLVVSSIDGRLYLREATRFDNRDTTLPNQLEDRAALLERMDQIYPWAHGDGFTGERSVDEHYSIQLFKAETVHNHGTLRFHLDGGTADVFRENQELRIDDLPSEPVGTWENDSIELSINGTPGKGPIEVTAIDAETGDPVDGTVAIGDATVARTGSDGVVWVLPPPGEYDLTVGTDDGSVTADGLD